MDWCSLAGTKPENISRSVPRLMPEYSIRTSASPVFGRGSGPFLSSHLPAATCQSARAVLCVSTKAAPARIVSATPVCSA